MLYVFYEQINLIFICLGRQNDLIETKKPVQKERRHGHCEKDHLFCFLQNKISSKIKGNNEQRNNNPLNMYGVYMEKDTEHSCIVYIIHCHFNPRNVWKISI